MSLHISALQRQACLVTWLITLLLIICPSSYKARPDNLIGPNCFGSGIIFPQRMPDRTSRPKILWAGLNSSGIQARGDGDRIAEPLISCGRLWLRGRAVVLQPEGRQYNPQSSPSACRSFLGQAAKHWIAPLYKWSVNANCNVKHFEWSPRLEELYMNTNHLPLSTWACVCTCVLCVMLVV